jgi:hypothetical protein
MCLLSANKITAVDIWSLSHAMRMKKKKGASHFFPFLSSTQFDVWQPLLLRIFSKFMMTLSDKRSTTMSSTCPGHSTFSSSLYVINHILSNFIICFLKSNVANVTPFLTLCRSKRACYARFLWIMDKWYNYMEVTSINWMLIVFSEHTICKVVDYR